MKHYFRRDVLALEADSAQIAFDGAAQAVIEEADHPRLRVHMAHIRPDVNPGMQGLLKDTPNSQLFTVFGQPRTRLKGPDKDGQLTVVMEGVDIYDPVTNAVTPTRADKDAGSGAAGAERGDEPSYRSSGGARTGELPPSASQRARLGAATRVNAHWAVDRKSGNRARRGTEQKALSSGYHSADNIEVIAPQIPAQSPNDRSNVMIKSVPLSGRS